MVVVGEGVVEVWVTVNGVPMSIWLGVTGSETMVVYLPSPHCAFQTFSLG